MKKIILIALVLVVLAVVALGGALLWATSYLRSPEFRTEIQNRASEAVGVKIAFDSLKIDLFKGVVVKDLQIDSPAPFTGKPFATVENVTVSYDLWDAIQSRRFIFNAITLNNPKVTLRQSRDGKFPLPGGEKPADPDAKGKKSKEKEETSTKVETAEGEKFEIALEKFDIKNGVIVVIEADGDHLLDVTGLVVSGTASDLSTSPKISGKLNTSVVKIGPTLTVNGFSTPFDYADGTISCPALAGSLYGGSLSGSVSAETLSATTPYELSLTLKSIDVPAMIKGQGGDPQKLDGSMDANFNATGSLSSAKALKGSGNVNIQPAVFGGDNVIRTIGSLLQVPELSNARFEQLKGNFNIAGETVNISSVTTEPRGKMQVSGSGRLGFNKNVVFDGIVEISPVLLRSIPALLQGRLPKSDDGFYKIPFKVTGTTENPKVAVNLGSALQDFAKQAMDSLLQGKVPDLNQLLKGSSSTPVEGAAKSSPKPEDAATGAAEELVGEGIKSLFGKPKK